jgi:hypothetical protein
MSRRTRRSPWALLAAAFMAAALILPTSGCRRQPVGSGFMPVAAPTTAQRGANIVVEDGAQATLFVLEPSNEGYQVQAAGGFTLGFVKVEADRVEAANERNETVYSIKRDKGGFTLYREPDGQTNEAAQMVRLRSSGSGFNITGSQDQELYRAAAGGAVTDVTIPGGKQMQIRERGNQTEVTDASGRRLIRVKGLRSASAAVFCAGREYDLLQRAAVTAYSARIAP